MKVRVLLCVVCVVVVGAAASVSAGEFLASVDVDVASSYVWRGIEIDDSWSLQPSFTLGYEFSHHTEVELEGWWNIALDDHDSEVWKDTVFEQDLVLSFSHSFSDAFNITAGYIHYMFPKSDIGPGSEEVSTSELFAGLGWSRGNGGVGLTVYRDFDHVKGWYFDLSGDLELPLGDRTAVELGGHLGFASGLAENPDDHHEEFFYLDDGLVDWLLSAGASYDFSDHVSIGGTVNLAGRLDDYEDETGLDEQYFFGVVSLGLSF